MRDDFAIFVLTHGRPAGVSATLGALRRARYTGRWFLVLDTEDDTADEYRARWGADRVLLFDKDEIAQEFDLADNFDGPRGVIVYARNAVPHLARQLGLRYFMQLDDDYQQFEHRYYRERDAVLAQCYTYRLDDVLEAFLAFLEDTGALTVALAQGGDLLGGLHGSFHRQAVKRKAMNTFIARTDRPVPFVGRLNEDVNTYVWRGSQGELFFTVLDIAIVQTATQQQGGGMTGAYLNTGSYTKSFYAVMFAPSCVRIAYLGDHHDRLHHQVAWDHAVPKIIPGRLRKPAAA